MPVLHLKIAPTGTVRSINVLQINQTSIRIMWEEVDCDKRNGRIIDQYILIISNYSNTYNLTSTERYITVNDLVLGGIYNISVAAVKKWSFQLYLYTYSYYYGKLHCIIFDMNCLYILATA